MALADDDSIDRPDELTRLQVDFNTLCRVLPDVVFLDELAGHLHQCRNSLSLEALMTTHTPARLLVLVQLEETAVGSGSRLEQSPVSFMIPQRLNACLQPDSIMAHRCWECYQRSASP